jgi:hypothetical protein
MSEPAFDRAIIKRLANALSFVSGAAHPATIAMKAAADSGADADVKKARTAFLKLKHSERQAALAMVADED